MSDYYSNYDWETGAMYSSRKSDAMWVNPSCTKTKKEAPYSYSEFFIYGNRDTIKNCDDAFYNDRIWQWDHEKADRLWKKHVGARWNNSGQGQHEAFMSAYLGKPVEIVALAEGCNVSNGYPYWIVWVKYLEKSA